MKSLRRGLKQLLDNRLIYFSSRRNTDSVVLTFDDGPDPELTPQVLQLLDDYGVQGRILSDRAECRSASGTGPRNSRPRSHVG